MVRLGASLLLVTIVATSATGKTWIVALDGSGDFISIQAAIDAASDGDVVVVRPGTYVGHVIVDKKQLSIVGSGVGNTVLSSDISTRAVARLIFIPADGRVALGHMTLRAFACLEVSSYEGSAIVSDVELRQAPYGSSIPGTPLVIGAGVNVAFTRADVVSEFPPDFFSYNRGHGAYVINGGFTALSQSYFQGYKGGDGTSTNPPYRGGAGVYAENTSIYLGEVNSKAGKGAPAWVGGPYCNWYWDAAAGGPGLEAVDQAVVVSASRVGASYHSGGNGGSGATTGCGSPTFRGGDGGDGAFTDATSRIDLSGPIQLLPGLAGDGIPDGQPGSETSGNVTLLPDVWPTLTIDGTGAIAAPVTLHVHADTGDRAVLIAADKFDKLIVKGIDGFPLFAVPGGAFFFVLPVGTVGASGTLDITFNLPDNPAIVGQPALFQSLVFPSSGAVPKLTNVVAEVVRDK